MDHRLVYLALVVLVQVPHIQAQQVDWSAWEKIVSTFITPGVVMQGVTINAVDYDAVRRSGLLPTVLQTLAEAPEKSSLGRNHTLALYINAYNALAMHTILSHACPVNSCEPIASIQDIDGGGVWVERAGVLAGGNVSLNDVEDYLRKPLPWQEDPRIHSAIVCASISCPNVQTTAFRGETLDQQLTHSMRDFLNNTRKGLHLNEASHVLTVSHIFHWFAEDFGDVIEFIEPYAPAAVQHYLATQPRPKLAFFDYNWDVNGPLTNASCPNCT